MEKIKLDCKLKDFLELYKMLKVEDSFYTDLKSGKIAKIEESICNKFSFHDYALISSSNNVINGKEFQYYIFRPGYFYKRGKFFFKKGPKREILFDSQKLEAQK